MSRLTCAFGSPWGTRSCGPCPKCIAEAARLDAEFDRGVFFGEWDRFGFTPADRRDQQRRTETRP